MHSELTKLILELTRALGYRNHEMKTDFKVIPYNHDGPVVDPFYLQRLICGTDGSLGALEIHRGEGHLCGGRDQRGEYYFFLKQVLVGTSTFVLGPWLYSS